MRLLLPVVVGVAAAVIVTVTCWDEFVTATSGPQRPAFLTMKPTPDLQPHVQSLVRRLASQDPNERAEAAIELRQLGPAGAPAANYLACLLEDRIPVRVERDGAGFDISAGDAGRTGYFTCPGALAATAMTASDQGVAALLGAISRGGDAARRSALEGAWCSSDSRLIDAMLNALSHEDRLVRDSAKAALTRTGPRATDGLASQLDSRVPQAAVAAAEILAHSDDPRALQVLVRASGSPVGRVRTVAGHGLSKIKPAEAMPPLIAMLADPALCEQAANVLQKLDHPERTWLLIDAMQQSRNFQLRAGAARALGLIRDPASAEALRQAQQDEHAAVRENASAALASVMTTR